MIIKFLIDLLKVKGLDILISLKNLLKTLAIFALLLSLLSCSTISYYSQSIHGHLSTWMKRQDIQAMLDDPEVKVELKQRLRLILKIREFASAELGLPNNYSFKSYVDIKREHIVWNVIAAPEFSVEPIKFCFPVVACLSYKGYFSKKRAEREATKLSAKGYDVSLGGVTAYSTLGWFSDPVLNTFVHWQEARLSGLIFHELAHQMIYIAGDTTFNESFASMVEIEGVNRWMQKRGTPELSKRYYLSLKRDSEFMQLIMHTRNRLKALYAKQLDAAQMRSKKAHEFARLRKEYLRYKKRWHGYSGYDLFVQSDMNNAKIASAATYFEYIKSFQNMLKQHQGDLPSFYQAVIRLGQMSIEQRHQQLNKLKVGEASLSKLK